MPKTTTNNNNDKNDNNDDNKHGNRSYKDPRRELHPSTAVITAGYRSDWSMAAIKAPIFRSSTFEFANAGDGELYFARAYNLAPLDDGVKPGLIYSRLNNPNTEILEDKMVALERGSAYASAFPSGMSAISTSVMALVPQGGHILYVSQVSYQMLWYTVWQKHPPPVLTYHTSCHPCNHSHDACLFVHFQSSPVYGGTYFFLKTICPDRLGVTTQAVDTSDLHKVATAIQNTPRLDAIYLESPANPTLRLTDIQAVRDLARQANPNCIIMVDNTLMGPVFQQPFLHGADVVLYSATKFIGGHSDLIAGIVLTQREDFINQINGYRTILGPVVAPDTCWMLARSLETLWMRMERQAEKAQKVAAALANHCRVDRVLFPGFYSCDGGDQRRVEQELYKRQCTGTGSMISIVVRPNTRRAAYTVLDGLRLAHLAVSLGSTESLVQHPRSMTHSDMSHADLDAFGICEGMLRISVGLEASEDLIQDLLNALDLIRDEHEDNGNTADGNRVKSDDPTEKAIEERDGTASEKSIHKEGSRHGGGRVILPHLALCCLMLLVCVFPCSCQAGSAADVDARFLVGTGIYDM